MAVVKTSALIDASQYPIYNYKKQARTIQNHDFKKGDTPFKFGLLGKRRTSSFET